MDEAEKLPLEGMDILILEDQSVVAAGLKKTLLKAGAAEVPIVGTMKEAWEIIGARNFDAALLDTRLPDGLSFPVAMHLFKERTPVVVHSGHAKMFHSAKFPGMIFVPKPSAPSVIVRAFENAKLLSEHPEVIQVDVPLG